MGKTSDRIKRLCKESGISVRQLEITLHFANGYISSINDNRIRRDRLNQIADYFNVLPEWVAGETEYRTKSERPETEKDLTDDQKKILSAYEEASPEFRHAALAVLQSSDTFESGQS